MWFVAISWAFWCQLVIIFSFFSYCHRQNIAFMSNWSWVIPKSPHSGGKKKKKKSAQASTCSLQVLVCSTAMMRHAALCARLQGVTHVRKEPPSPPVPFPSLGALGSVPARLTGRYSARRSSSKECKWIWQKVGVLLREVTWPLNSP